MFAWIATLSRRGPVLRTLAAASIIGAAACQDPGRPVGPTKDPDAPKLEPALHEQALYDSDPEVASLVATVPGFGGFYLDDGVATVYLTDLEQRPAAEAALADYGEIRVLQGEYTYEQLDGWFQRLSPEALALPGAVMVDLDEAKNRVFVGVEHAAAAAAARGVVDRLDLPAGAVVVEEVKPVYRLATLRDNVQPVVGGLQIETGKVNCTLGFNALTYFDNGNTPSSFITNSHCTNFQGGVEGTLFTQGFSGPIAIEVDDPGYWPGVGWSTIRCPQGRVCRWSDAARVRYATVLSTGLPVVRADFLIARTQYPNYFKHPNLDIVGHFRITGDIPYPSRVGLIVHKVGRTTGWTSGELTRTCTDINVAPSPLLNLPTNITLLCQASVKALRSSLRSGQRQVAKPGDSGSPVFIFGGGGRDPVSRDRYAWMTTTNVSLAGIVWGGDEFEVDPNDPNSPWVSEFWFSGLGNIEQELGGLYTY